MFRQRKSHESIGGKEGISGTSLLPLRLNASRYLRRDDLCEVASTQRQSNSLVIDWLMARRPIQIRPIASDPILRYSANFHCVSGNPF